MRLTPQQSAALGNPACPSTPRARRQQGAGGNGRRRSDAAACDGGASSARCAARPGRCGRRADASCAYATRRGGGAAATAS